MELANYYKWFVKDFTKVVKPLHEIRRKNVKWNRRERQQKAFEELKKRFMTELALVISNLNKDIRIKVDILDFATDGVLLMKCENVEASSLYLEVIE